MLAGARAGFDVVVSAPADLGPDPALFARIQAEAKAAGTHVGFETDPAKACAGARCVYADTWVSMGQEAEGEALKKKLAGYTIDAAMMKHAAPDAVFMHCLPAHRGEEAAAEVIDGPQSIIFDQAENRLHAQKAVLMLLSGVEPW
jgi:ornithine carbamoyltransferase